MLAGTHGGPVGHIECALLGSGEVHARAIYLIEDGREFLRALGVFVDRSRDRRWSHSSNASVTHKEAVNQSVGPGSLIPKLLLKFSVRLLQADDFISESAQGDVVGNLNGPERKNIGIVFGLEDDVEDAIGDKHYDGIMTWTPSDVNPYRTAVPVELNDTPYCLSAQLCWTAPPLFV